MNILNYYFTPFAVILILSAIYFSQPEKNITFLSFAVLFIFFFINYWFSKNAYKFVRWFYKIRMLLVWLNLITSGILFYLLGSFWAPMWLLFLTAPATAGMFMKKKQVLIITLSSVFLMLGIYYLKSVILDIKLGQVQWAMASIHAVFVIFFALFVQAMSEMLVKIRDTLK